MPTAVSVARQCLTSDAAQALDEAVGVARRRGHAQTTSLHAVSALLTLPSSALRDACARARGGSPYSPRLQFKALELCLSVSLDRVPSGQVSEDPPVSNSLMAAIKRSQANQRRQPENFHLYHQLSSSQSSSINNVIKVELQHLILSILDDPVVSRVFGEAGFRSSEIKLAIIRPLPHHHLLRYSSSSSRPPMFLCNLNQSDPSPCSRFPFSVGFSDLDDNHRQIGEILGRSKGRNNPVLVGATASTTVKGFIQTLSLRGIFGYRVIDMESCGGGYHKVEEEVGKMTNTNTNTNTNTVVLVVNIGDLKSLSEEDDDGVVVTRLTTLLGNHGGKMRLMGWVESYDTYSIFVNKYPSVEKDWELQVLPIPTLRPASSMPELLSYPRSRLMESFVPFGGFFSSSTDLNGPAMSTTPPSPTPPNHQCTSSLSQKSDAAAAATTNHGFPKTPISVSDRCQYTLPSWMQMSELAPDPAHVKDDSKWGNKQEEQHEKQPKIVVGFLASSESKKSGDDDALRCRTSGNGCVMEPTRKQNNPGTEEVDSISGGGGGCGSNDECRRTSPASATSTTTTSNIIAGLHNNHDDEFCDLNKKLYGGLMEKVGRQEEAIRVVSETVAACSRMKSSENRGDLWLSFLGPDPMGKRKVAVSLCELLYGSSNRDNHLIDVDLCPSPEDEDSRGKVLVDVIAAELTKKPMAVVFLENMDKADDQVQTSLFQAIWTGKFSDSFGREVRVNRAIFITTSTFTTPKQIPPPPGAAPKYNEDTILAAAAAAAAAGGGTRLPSVKIIVEKEEDTTMTMKPLLNKRKLVDLNLLPAEIMEHNNNDAAKMVMSESSKAWLLDFFDRTDAAVVFTPYDFDSLADNILRDVRSRLVMSMECSIQIHTKVMQQLLSAVYMSDSYKVLDDWIAQLEAHTTTLTATPSTVRRLTVCQDDDDHLFSQHQSSSLP